MLKRIAVLALAVTFAACSEGPVEPEADWVDLDAPVFAQTFNSPTAGQLEDVADAYEEVSPNVFRRKAAVSDADRQYVRTVETDFNQGDFVAELLFTLSGGQDIHFFGVGPGTPVSNFTWEPSGALFRIHTTGHVNGRVDVVVRNSSSNLSFATIGNITSTGTYRAVIAKQGGQMLFGIDTDGDGVLDKQHPVSFPAHLDASTSRIFFGTTNRDSFVLSIIQDSDGDGVLDPADNCPAVPNPDQTDTDGDGLGDACDPDDDNDGFDDVDDDFPTDPTEWVDTDGDGIGNNADTDDDGDGLPDVDEQDVGTDPLDPDTDDDGVLDGADPFPISDQRATVEIGSCDSGVSNQALGDGSTFMDRIGAAQASARNHGHFVSAVSALADGWKKDGLISGRDKGQITSCAARSNGGGDEGRRGGRGGRGR